MNAGTLRALEFDRIVAALADLAVTPSGRDRLARLQPSTDAGEIQAAQRATAEGVRFGADHPGFPLRAPSDLDVIAGGLAVEGRPLEPLQLVALAVYLESIEQSRAAIAARSEPFPILRAIVARAASFAEEIRRVRRAIGPSGEVLDEASPALGTIRDRLRRHRGKLRSTLESLIRSRDTAKYLQEQVVTDRNGRYVLMVRSEHRSAIPGVVHGASASGASLFLEPLETLEINNEIVQLEEQEAEEVRRILLSLTDGFRGRGEELAGTLDVAAELDEVQARARFAERLGAVEPVIADDGTLELRGARHPLLVLRGRRSSKEDRSPAQGPDSELSSLNDLRPHFVVPVDIELRPPVHVLVIAGPNTGGKTVALKTAGLLALMAQAGLHVPAEKASRLPVFQSVFADIGDEQSISASLSTFSAHITNIASMDRDLHLPALILLDELGAGTDPVEGGALGVAIIDRFRRRGAHLIATTHYDALKSYASTTEGVAGAAFGFDPETFAPTYRLMYGSPGRSLAIEIAARLGMPSEVVAAARENLSEPQKLLAEHLARVDEDLRRLEEERRQIARERSAVTETERKLRAREESLGEREERIRRRLDAKIDEQLREARREIETVIETLKERTAELSERAAVRLNASGKLRPAGVTTGDVGAARADARAALEQIAERLKGGEGSAPAPAPDAPIDAGARVRVGTLGLEGTVVEVRDTHAEVDVRGKRLRAALRDLTVIGPGGSAPRADVRVQVELQPRGGAMGELNLIGSRVDEALDRLDKFLDQSATTDLHEIRVIHGHGTGQLRRAVAGFLKTHPLVERFEPAPENQGGGGATIVYLRD